MNYNFYKAYFAEVGKVYLELHVYNLSRNSAVALESHDFFKNKMLPFAGSIL